MSDSLSLPSPDKSEFENKPATPPVVDESLLWRSFTAGSESAFISIYRQYFQVLYNYGRQFTGDSALIKDCIQDIFIVLRKSRNKLTPISSIKAYLFKAIRRRILHEIKKDRKARPFAVNEPSLDFQIIPSIENVIIERQFRNDQLKKINYALNDLSQRQREAIYYYYYNDLTYSEIKDLMGFSSVEAARNLLYRALSTIKQSIASL